MDRAPPEPLTPTHKQPKEWKPITMPGIIAFVLLAIVAVTVLSIAVHILFSPLVLVAIGILVWMKFRPRRSHQ
jgi:uncharacterized protein involved in cysteine biosynthesis